MSEWGSFEDAEKWREVTDHWVEQTRKDGFSLSFIEFIDGQPIILDFSKEELDEHMAETGGVLDLWLLMKELDGE
jgi:hypothetical protein